MVDVGDDDSGGGIGSDDIYREKGWNLCWFCSLIHILKKKSQYVIAGPLLVLPTCPTDYFYY